MSLLTVISVRRAGTSGSPLRRACSSQSCSTSCPPRYATTTYHLPPTTSPSPCPAHALLRRPHVCHREPSCSSRRHASRCVGCVWGVWGVCGVWRCACMFVWRYLCFVCLPACARACVPLPHQDDMVFALRPLPSAKEETKRNPKSACPFPPPPSSCLFSRLEPPLLALVGTLPVVPHTIL